MSDTISAITFASVKRGPNVSSGLGQLQLFSYRLHNFGGEAARVSEHRELIATEGAIRKNINQVVA